MDDDAQQQFSWESAYYPSYFFNPDALPNKYLDNPSKGTTSTTYDLVVGGRTAKEAVILHTDGNLKDLIKIKFDKMDAWLEEDEEIYIHPRDPYKVRAQSSHLVVRRDVVIQRIDIRQSSRQVRIELDGVVLANTNKPRLLYETGLIVRTYIPMGDVRLECLSKSELTTGCPYKVLFLSFSSRGDVDLNDLGVCQLLRRQFIFRKEERSCLVLSDDFSGGHGHQRFYRIPR